VQTASGAARIDTTRPPHVELWPIVRPIDAARTNRPGCRAEHCAASPITDAVQVVLRPQLRLHVKDVGSTRQDPADLLRTAPGRSPGRRRHVKPSHVKLMIRDRYLYCLLPRVHVCTRSPAATWPILWALWSQRHSSLRFQLHKSSFLRVEVHPPSTRLSFDFFV